MTDGLEIVPVRGIGDVTAGDDLSALITSAAPWLRDGDVLVVTSKIVSKAEGRLVEVPADGPERDAARERALVSETARVVARRGPTAIVQTHQGFVMAAAGIDASNVDKTHLVLLPADPDASARGLRAALLERGLDVAVIVSDTMGRAWRNGLTDVALGAAGIEPFRDHRGEIDPYGNELQLTEMAVIDELAAAGELVKGKMDQVPVAVVRGYPRTGLGDNVGSRAGAAALLRDAASDMFSLGTAEARAAGLRAAATLPNNPATPAHGAPDEFPGAAPPNGRLSAHHASPDDVHAAALASGQATADHPSPDDVRAATLSSQGSADHPLPGDARAATVPSGGAMEDHASPDLRAAAPPPSSQASADRVFPGDVRGRATASISPRIAGHGLDGGVHRAPIDLDAVDRALATVAAAITPGTTIAPAEVPPGVGAAGLRLTPAEGTAAALIGLGVDAHRLRAALAAEGIATQSVIEDGTVLIAMSA
jgi:coenzyme F420-0:L-glutamate ligase/coenzyme F420-1:gamma-L-glutamate ligase